MLRLFFILMFVLVFSITIIPYSYANHDAVSSHVQNNTGWDREIFHKYTLHSFADKFGYVIFPVLENSILKYNSTGETKYNQNILAGSVTLYINASNVNTDLHIAFPNILKYDNSLHVMASREIPYMVEAFTPTHTHIIIQKDDLDNEIHMTSTGMLGGMPVQGVLNKLESDNYDYLFPPLKQTQNRVYSQDILCKEHLDLILSPTYSPACVNPESIPKLVERGWTQSV